MIIKLQSTDPEGWLCAGGMHGSHWKWETESILQVDWAWLGIEVGKTRWGGVEGEYGETARTEEH